MYSLTTDVGLFNIGLNLSLCGLLAVLGGGGVITDATRTISLRFNTYNGQKDGLFSSVDITARFSLGKEAGDQTGKTYTITPLSGSNYFGVICGLYS